MYWDLKFAAKSLISLALSLIILSVLFVRAFHLLYSFLKILSFSSLVISLFIPNTLSSTSSPKSTNFTDEVFCFLISWYLSLFNSSSCETLSINLFSLLLKVSSFVARLSKKSIISYLSCITEFFFRSFKILSKFNFSFINEKLNLDNILKDLKKNSVIHERYEIIDFLLNLATKDETFNSKENKFIDRVSQELELNKDKYQEIKKQKTSSVKFVDFGEEVEESVFGINKDMTKDEKLKILRKEYSRWNALTNNTDKMIRERAKEMRDLAANLRSQYNK